MMVSRADLLRRASEAVLGPVLKDFRKGLIEEEDVKETARRRAPAIQALFLEMDRESRAKPQHCADCPAPATTVKGGKPYCAAHSKLHTMEPP